MARSGACRRATSATRAARVARSTALPSGGQVNHERSVGEAVHRRAEGADHLGFHRRSSGTAPGRSISTRPAVGRRWAARRAAAPARAGHDQAADPLFRQGEADAGPPAAVFGQHVRAARPCRSISASSSAPSAGAPVGVLWPAGAPPARPSARARPGDRCRTDGGVSSMILVSNAPTSVALEGRAPGQAAEGDAAQRIEVDPPVDALGCPSRSRAPCRRACPGTRRSG